MFLPKIQTQVAYGLCALLLWFVGRAENSYAMPPAETSDIYIQDPLMRPFQDDIIYFLMVDRFNNADPENDQGAPAGHIAHGAFDPTALRSFHGGDLQGVIAQLDYLQALGISAIWMTPIVLNQAHLPRSKGYHGYWGIDFMQVDPHFGDGKVLQQLVHAAHQRGIKVFLDVVVNHTGDIIHYKERRDEYRPLAKPPYTPEVAERYRTVKNPAWLNDTSHYNNRGNSSFTGESSVYGDFFGLDDLDTRQPDVLQGMLDIFKYWIKTYRIDGFRVDTVKHVDIEFWQQFVPQITAFAHDEGIPNFILFGEVYSHKVSEVADYTKRGQFASVLDFPLQAAAVEAFSQQGSTMVLGDILQQDDGYRDQDSDAQQLVTFLGNHDKGRFAMYLQQHQPKLTAEQRLKHVRLANAFLIFNRGVPAIYYGDEQGFVGDGGDADARQDMFPSKVPSYNDDDLIGTEKTTADNNFDPKHPLYQAIAAFAAVYRQHPVLRRGQQVTRYQSQGVGAVAFAKLMPHESEYVLVFNTSKQAQTVEVPVLMSQFVPVWPTQQTAVLAVERQQLTLDVPALDFVIYRSKQRWVPEKTAKPIQLLYPKAKQRLKGVIPIQAQVDAAALATQPLNFWLKVEQQDWQRIGQDVSAPYRIFWDSRAIEKAEQVQIAVSWVTDGEQETAPDADAAMVQFSVDQHVLEQFELTYQNVNQRQSYQLLHSDGRMTAADYLDDNRANVKLQPSDMGIVLLFGSEVDGLEWQYDRPYFADMQQLSALAEPDDKGRLQLSAMLSQQGDWWSQAQFQQWPADAGSHAAQRCTEAPFAQTPMFLRGSHNGWQAAAPLAYQEGAYQQMLLLKEGAMAYKVADQDWSAQYNLGAPIQRGGVTADGQSGNLQFDVPETAVYQFELMCFQQGEQRWLLPQFRYVETVDMEADESEWQGYAGHFQQGNMTLEVQVVTGALSVSFNQQPAVKFYLMDDDSGRFASEYGLLTPQLDENDQVMGYNAFKRVNQ